MNHELIDSHCHLDFDYSPKTPQDLILEAAAAGVTTLVTVGTETKTFDVLVEISEKNATVFHTIGIHPHETQKITPGDLDEVRKRISHPKCVAVGEIGLDYYYDHSPRESQKQCLTLQLEIAREARLPVVIHARDAEADLGDALEDHVKKLKGDVSPGVIHCFTGTKEFGERCLDLGFYISFSGILTFKNSEDLRKSAAIFPIDRLLVETDSPFLAPVPMRGKKCEPAMVAHTARKLAEIKRVSFEEICQKTFQNTQKVFGLKKEKKK